MIILDGPLPKKRPAARRLSDESIGSSQTGLPSYQSNVSERSVQPMVDSEPPQSRPVPESKKTDRDRRFWKGLAIALGVYTAISLTIAVPLFIAHRYTEDHSSYQRMKPPGGTRVSAIGDIPVVPMNVPKADGSVLGCNLWDYTDNYEYPNNLQYSKLTYCLPHNATNIWLHALGGREGLVSGQFTVKLNPDARQLDYMVDVILTYPIGDCDAKNSTAICLMQENDAWGVGFYTFPGALNHSLDYQITLYTPQARAPLDLPRFSTFLPWFQHTFEDLNDLLNFGDVEIGGIASPVHGTISAQTVNVTTSHAAITGNYRASDTLILQTSNAKIDTNITLGSTIGQQYPTSLYMKSSKGSFSATVNLSASGTNNTSSNSSSSPINPNIRPQYNTRISCEDSPVTLIIRHEDTVDSSDLDVQVNTTLNRAVVLLDPKFEGTFDLHSINGTVLVADIDGNEQSAPDVFMGSFPNYRRSFEVLHQSASRAGGCVKRTTTTQPPKAQVRMENHLALLALGFFKPGDNPPNIPADFGVV